MAASSGGLIRDEYKMIGFFIFAFVLVLAFCTWFPDYVGLLEPIVVAVGAIWLIIKIIGLWRR